MTSTVSRAKDYTDIDLDFNVHPVTKDINKVVGPIAIGRAIRNLVLTNFYERPFRSYIGSSAQKLLFDNISPLTANLIQQHIKDVIENFEPRAIVSTVNVVADPDNNGYTARIVFQVNNRQEPYVTTIFLERVR
jgi:phage baseplate assembly protein W